VTSSSVTTFISHQIYLDCVRATIKGLAFDWHATPANKSKLTTVQEAMSGVKRKRALSTAYITPSLQVEWAPSPNPCLACKLGNYNCKRLVSPPSYPQPKCKRCTRLRPSLCCPDPSSNPKLLTRRQAQIHRQRILLLSHGIRQIKQQRRKITKLRLEREATILAMTAKVEAEARAAAQQRAEAVKHRQDIDEAITRMKEAIANLQDGVGPLQMPDLDSIGEMEEDPKAIMESLAVLMTSVAGLVACTAAEMRAVKGELDSVKRELDAVKAKNSIQEMYR